MSKIGADLRHRTLSALVLGAVALAAAVAGGLPFAVLWTAAGIAMLWEWGALASIDNRRIWLAIGSAGLAGAVALLLFSDPHLGYSLAMLGAAAGAFAAPRQSGWAVSGILVAAAAAIPVVALRGEGHLGLVAVLFLCAIVWATDICAYFTGRLIGGAKLWPAVSPNKTWSGSIGGTVAGVAAGLIVAAIAGLPHLLPLALLGFVLSVAAQAGDLAESAIKRHFGVKDAGRLIPGHGGLLDRLDGFTAAALIALLVAELRGAADPAASLLLW